MFWRGEGQAGRRKKKKQEKQTTQDAETKLNENSLRGKMGLMAACSNLQLGAVCGGNASSGSCRTRLSVCLSEGLPRESEAKGERTMISQLRDTSKYDGACNKCRITERWQESEEKMKLKWEITVDAA